MSYEFKGKRMKNDDAYNEPKETVKEVSKLPFVDVPERGIRKETLKKFGVRVGYDETDGTTLKYVYFPSYSQKGRLLGYKRQDLSVPKEDKGHWKAIGNISIGNKLFGQQVVEEIARKRNNLTCTEGEWDMLSCWQAMTDSVAGTKYEGLEPFVVSIPMGTANAVESLLHNEHFVKSFDGMTLFFDDDHCTPAERAKKIMKGHEARDAVAGAFVGSGLKLYTIQPEFSFKDASDYTQNEKDAELAKLVQFGRKVYTMEKIIRSSDISDDELLEPRPEGIDIPQFPKLMKKIHGLRGGEFILLTSPSGVGKSTTTAIFSQELRKSGEKIGLMFLEETRKETIQRFVASEMRMNYLEFKNNPVACAIKYGHSREKVLEIKHQIDTDDNIVMLNHFGSMPIEDLMNKIRHMHFIDGCRFIMLDHLSLVVSGTRVADERKELDIVCTELASFCAANDCTVIAVSHINRTNSDQFRPPKGKEDEPYWVRVTKESLRGSAALEQLSFIILGLEPEILPDRSRGRVRWVVLKNRPWSYLGEGDTFSIDENTWEVLLSEDGGF